MTERFIPRTIKIISKSLEVSEVQSITSSDLRVKFQDMKMQNLLQAEQLGKHFKYFFPSSDLSIVPFDEIKSVEESLNFTDLICTVGGDGLFLQVSSKVGSEVPKVLGINSNPSNSIGHFLPVKFSLDLAESDSVAHQLAERLYMNQFEEQYRYRIKSRITRPDGSVVNLPLGKYYFLKLLALNDIFLGEI